ncbi:MAG: hypothetical protein ABWK00_03830 [Desulfurococcaceae archaeon]
MADALLVGVDLGTSAVKVEVYDLRGNAVMERRGQIRGQTVDEWLRAFERPRRWNSLRASRAGRS